MSDINVDQFIESVKRNNGQSGFGTTEYQGDKPEEDVKIIVNGESNTAIGPEVEVGSSAAVKEAAEPNDDDKARDLCSAVRDTMAMLPHPVVVITTLDRTYQTQEADGVPIEKMRHPIARGITASSFTSLSVRPKPHVMFNMTLPSTMYEALVACRDFNVHVLTPDIYGAQIASVFTRGNRLPPLHLGDPEQPVYPFDIDADLGVFLGLKDEGIPYSKIINRDVWHTKYQKAKEAGLRVLASTRGVESVAQNTEMTKPVKQVHPVPYIHTKGVIKVLHCRLVSTIDPEIAGAGQNAIIIGEVVDTTNTIELAENRKREPVALGYADRKYRAIGNALDPHQKDNSTD